MKDFIVVGSWHAWGAVRALRVAEWVVPIGRARLMFR